MTHCELCEIELSAVLDGEADGETLPTALDHLVTCRACQAFYRGARAVDAAVARGQADPPPERVWRRIEAEVRVRRFAFPARRAAVWAARLAAAVLVGAGLWSLGVLRPPSLPVGDAVEVRLEADRGDMSDERFVRLTTELLRADRRYHRKMMDILAVVNRDLLVEEGGEGWRESEFPNAALASGGDTDTAARGAGTGAGGRRIYW